MDEKYEHDYAVAVAGAKHLTVYGSTNETHICPVPVC